MHTQSEVYSRRHIRVSVKGTANSAISRIVAVRIIILTAYQCGPCESVHNCHVVIV